MTMKALLRISLLASVALLTANPAMADVKAGVEAWSKGDYARAINEWKGPAERGDIDAQFNMGQAYKLGRGVPVDLAKAEDLFAKAAARGHLQAADNYGLLLFQRGERAGAMPYIQSAADRGDPRSQYLLGIAHFNGDVVAKDWVRAYALVSLAQQSGLAQAAPALAQMDKYIPIEQRQQSVTLAAELSAASKANRERQSASLDLGASVPQASSTPPASSAAAKPAPRRTAAISADSAAATAARAANLESARTAGADYARPQTPAVATPPASVAKPQAAAPAKPAAAAAKPAATLAKPATPPPAPAAPAPAAAGGWRVQLGAFGVAANADAMWNRVRTRPELSGRSKLLVPAGKVSKLQATGFASQADAQSTCSRLSAAGFSCLAVRN